MLICLFTLLALYTWSFQIPLLGISIIGWIEVPCLLCLFIAVCAPCNSGKLVLQIDLVLLNLNLLILRKHNHGLSHLTCFFSKETHSYLSLFASHLINHWRYIKKRSNKGGKRFGKLVAYKRRKSFICVCHASNRCLAALCDLSLLFFVCRK